MSQSKNIADDVKNSATHGTKTHIYYIREHVRRYMDEHDMSLNEFAEFANISPHTVHSILYKDLDDCKLSTAIAIATAIGIGVDELANTGALPDKSLESVMIARSLPPHIIELIRRYIRWQKDKYEKFRDYPGKLIDVMDLDYVDDHLRTTDHLEKVDISEFDADIKSIVFRGMRIPCNEYIQYYRENDILLLSAIRQPKARERCVILYFDRVFIVQRDRKDGVPGYRGIRDDEVFIPETEISYYFGYVAGVKHG